MEGGTYGQIDGWNDEHCIPPQHTLYAGGWKDGCMGEWTDGMMNTVYPHSILCMLGLARVICGKAKFCLRMVRWFFSGFSGFRPPSMNDRLDISEIFLKGP